ncbi:ATP synthase F1 subunit delta [Candidatus Anaplasma sp. TIGMIC]|uniref:ATP synthase F1 subunit delta n=1 Tax=Candidatus Anaplasma sp. TIGMIC TaxID=3020713 RepID=UPI00232D5902|nr:ATP synthase F1 subunit delta [Candidatus Anaplasma sp. TIGMIC]MDB1135630.1 ATP synthase F1 subunit delta [Candidatus Anaplasma sp. TIGMIC]
MNHRGGGRAAYAYARVLLDLSRDKADSISAEIRAMSQVFEEADVCRFFASPVVSVEDKVSILKDMGRRCALDGILVNFMCVAVADGMSSVLCDIFEEFFALLRRARGMFRLEITTAVPMSKKEEKKILDVVLSKYGKPEAITKRVDPEILGGFVAKGDSFVIDASYVGKLRELSKVFREAIIGI